MDKYIEENKPRAGLGSGLWLRSGVTFVVARGINTVLQVASTVLLARLLSPYNFGLVTVVTALVKWFDDEQEPSLLKGTRRSSSHGYPRSVLLDGTPWRPLIDVADMARAIDWAIDRKPENGGRYLAVNVGSDDGNRLVERNWCSRAG